MAQAADLRSRCRSTAVTVLCRCGVHRPRANPPQDLLSVNPPRPSACHQGPRIPEGKPDDPNARQRGCPHLCFTVVCSLRHHVAASGPARRLTSIHPPAPRILAKHSPAATPSAAAGPSASRTLDSTPAEAAVGAAFQETLPSDDQTFSCRGKGLSRLSGERSLRRCRAG